ncbi:MAG: ribbon-helix-helix domain-containing protein [Candidatus Bathyarchaeota archaeon]|nr:ribbon-helix-helix domain-containing protein [Candidatus Bathyarchaeota archaeon]
MYNMRSRKVKISVSLDASLVSWIDKKVDDFTFQNRSDGLEKAIYKLKTETENLEKLEKNTAAQRIFSK